MTQLKRLWQPVVLGVWITLGLLALLQIDLGSAQAARGEIYCVVPDPTLSTTYPVCDRVFTSLQAAVDASRGGESIRVAAGYYGGVQPRAGLTQALYLHQSVAIRGGYTIPFTLAPDALAHPTRLDAQGAGRVIYLAKTISATLEGLEMVGGDATNLGGFAAASGNTDNDAGGGIYGQGVTVTLRGNIIGHNLASGQRYGCGGGIHLAESQANLYENTLEHNQASQYGTGGAGGAICVVDSQAIISGNTIFSNSSAITAPLFSVGVGGGIAIQNSVFTIAHNLILSNTTLMTGSLVDNIDGIGYPPRALGGGIYVGPGQNGAGYIFSNTIQGNIAHKRGLGFGGGIYIEGGAPMLIRQNQIQGNYAGRVYDGFGGGIYATNSQVTISQNTLLRNTGTITAFHFSAGGGISIENSVFTITENLILSNTALFSSSLDTGFVVPQAFGGAIAVGSGQEGQGKPGLILSNTIRGNVAHEGGLGFGGGIYLQTGDPIMVGHNHIQGNIAGKAVGVWSGSGGGIAILSPANATLDANLIEHNTAAISGAFGIGGGVDVYFFDTFASPRIVTLTHNVIRENIALASGDVGAGGGVRLGGPVTLKYNLIMSNTALILERPILTDTSHRGGIGGGIYAGGYFYTGSLNGDRLQANMASLSANGWGGGLYIEGGQVTATNLAIIDNQAATAGGGLTIGGGATVTFSHTTLARNPSGDGSGLLIYDALFGQALSSSPSTVRLTNTLFSEQALGLRLMGHTTITIAGILWDQVPLTVSASPTASLAMTHAYTGPALFAGDGYHILPGSAAIDRGLPTSLLVDIDNQPRQGLPDLGADEASPWSYFYYLPYISR